MATKAEVRQRIGEDLGLVPIGQDLENQDKVRIDTSINEAYEFLKEKGLTSWASTGDIPDKIAPYFRLLVENKLLISYSVPEVRYIRIMTEGGANGQVALAKISELTIQEYESNESDCGF